MVTHIALIPATNATCSTCQPRRRGAVLSLHTLTTDGETIEELEQQHNQAMLEREVSKWLRAKITQIELSGPNKP
jgi:hypothetical protein